MGRALSGFGVVLAVQTCVGVVQTAGLLRALGPERWGIVNVAQAAGLLCTTLVTAGLGAFGASVVALRPSPEHADFFLGTMGARTRLFALVAVILGALVWILSPRDGPAAALVACTTLLSGLGGSWYFVGRGEPARWLATEVIPIAGGTIIGVVLALWGGTMFAFALPFAAGGVVAVGRTLRAVRLDRDVDSGPVQMVTTRAFLKEHSSLLVAGLAGGVNGQGPALLLAATGAPNLPSWLLLDRMVKYVMAGAAPVLQVAQRWVPAGSPEGVRDRGLRALAVATVGGIVAALLFVLLASPTAAVLSSGTVTVTQGQVQVFALLVGVLLVTQVNALAVLVPLGLRRLLARSTSIGAVVLVLAGLAAGTAFGAPGVVFSVLLVETGILIVQASAVLRSQRRGPRPPEPSDS